MYESARQRRKTLLQNAFFAQNQRSASSQCKGMGQHFLLLWVNLSHMGNNLMSEMCTKIYILHYK